MLPVYLPNPQLSTDNAIMIALAGHAQTKNALLPHMSDTIHADGNKSLSEE